MDLEKHWELEKIQPKRWLVFSKSVLRQLLYVTVIPSPRVFVPSTAIPFLLARLLREASVSLQHEIR